MVRNSGFFYIHFFPKMLFEWKPYTTSIICKNWECFKLKSCCWNCCSGPSNRLKKTSLAQPKQLTIPLNTLPSIWILVNSYHFFYLLFLGFKNLTILTVHTVFPHASDLPLASFRKNSPFVVLRHDQKNQILSGDRCFVAGWMVDWLAWLLSSTWIRLMQCGINSQKKSMVSFRPNLRMNQGKRVSILSKLFILWGFQKTSTWQLWLKWNKSSCNFTLECKNNLQL